MKNQNYLLIIVANITFLIASIIVSDIEGLRVVSAIQLILNTYYYFRGNRKYLSVGVIFFWLLFLFHCSRFVFLEDDGFYTIDKSFVTLSFKFTICCLSTLSAGYFMSRSKKKSYDVSHSEVELSNKDLLRIRRISLYILSISIIPFLYVDLSRLFYTMTYGYTGLYSIGEENMIFKYFAPISHLFRPSVILLMVSYYRLPKVATRILILFCVYSMVMMLSGARITALVYILSIVVVYSRFVLKRIKVSQFVVTTAVAIFLFTLLPVISSMRREGVSQEEYQTATDVVQDSGGSFTSAITEFGGSQIDVIYAIAFTRKFNCGMTYLASLVCISPKLPSSLDRTHLTYTQSFPINYQISFGGSCIGEAYYNFGWFAVFFFLIVGLLIGRLEHVLCRLNRNNLIMGIFCLMLIPGLFTWVRDFFMIFVFTAFWFPVIFRIVMGVRR